MEITKDAQPPGRSINTFDFVLSLYIWRLKWKYQWLRCTMCIWTKGWSSWLLRGSSPDLPWDLGSARGHFHSWESKSSGNSTQQYFSFCSILDMALSSILTEAEIAAGLQSCQGNSSLFKFGFAVYLSNSFVLATPKSQFQWKQKTLSY